MAAIGAMVPPSRLTKAAREPRRRHSMGDGSLLLLQEAARVLGLNQRGLVPVLNSSLRTVQRIHTGRSSLTSNHWGRLVRAVYPKDPALAARIAASQRTTLADFGVALPPPPPQPVSSPPPPRAVSPRAADSVVCAAADAMNAPPRVARPVVEAAFACAREMGLSVEAVAAALQAPRPMKAANEAS